MEFNYTEEQEIVKSSLNRFFAEIYDIPKRKSYLAEESGFSQVNWERMAELGILGLPFAEADGGLGGGLPDILIAMEEIGYSLAIEPYMHSVILPSALIDYVTPEFDKASFVEEISSGKRIVTFGSAEKGARFNLANIRTAARKDGEAYVLSGAKAAIPYGPSANQIVISARLTGGDRDESGIALFLLDPKMPGVTLNSFHLIDGIPACDVILDDVRLEASSMIVTPDKGYTALLAIANLATFAISAEMLGVLKRMFEKTLEYMQTRVQFGRPLAAKQVVRHRLADMYMHTEQARSAVIGGALSAPGSPDWQRSASAAKVRVATAAHFIGKQTIQLHGGIGVTDEYEVSHYYKRLMSLHVWFGDDKHHAKVLAA